ncbi:MAG: hypothetical protein OIN66_02420 [Candidatus Methanoperedens sp.]|nr:hypothetical protein [Candidatus Methanoperedens sp.]
MIDWNDPQVKLVVYLIYGTSFIIMFFAIMVWRNRVSHIELMNDFKYLAAFGLLHGLAEYSDIPRFLAWQPAWAYDLVKLILVSSSFAALLAFGLSVISAGIEERRWMRGIPYGAIAMYFWLLAFVGLDTIYGEGKGISYALVDLAQRHSLGFLGAFTTSYAFLELSGKMNAVIGTKAARRFMYAGICFALYAVFGGIIIAPVLGIPPVVYRSAIALLITIAVIRIFHMFKVKHTE